MNSAIKWNYFFRCYFNCSF